MACSRQTFAFPRDGALPLSRCLYRMNKHTHTPVNCVWEVTGAGILLGLLAFAGKSTIDAIFNLAIVGLYLAFAIPIASRLFGGSVWRPGPFSLRKLVSKKHSEYSCSPSDCMHFSERSCLLHCHLCPSVPTGSRA